MRSRKRFAKKLMESINVTVGKASLEEMMISLVRVCLSK
jgi:hypothetical protein